MEGCQTVRWRSVPGAGLGVGRERHRSEGALQGAARRGSCRPRVTRTRMRLGRRNPVDRSAAGAGADPRPDSRSALALNLRDECTDQGRGVRVQRRRGRERRVPDARGCEELPRRDLGRRTTGTPRLLAGARGRVLRRRHDDAVWCRRASAQRRAAVQARSAPLRRARMLRAARESGPPRIQASSRAPRAWWVLCQAKPSCPPSWRVNPRHRAAPRQTLDGCIRRNCGILVHSTQRMVRPPNFTDRCLVFATVTGIA